MRVAGDPAYVLHHRPYSETSLLIEAYTRGHGRVGLIAKGARRPRSPARGLLAPFQPVLINYSGRGELAVVTGVEPNGLAHALAGEPLYCGFYLNEILMRVTTRHDAHERLFDLYHATLARLATGADPSPALRIFEKRLLSELGYGLLLDRDATSKSLILPDARYDYMPETGPVSVTEGSVAHGVEVSGAALLALAAENFADAVHLRAARAVLRACLERHLGDRPLESRRLIREARARVPAVTESDA